MTEINENGEVTCSYCNGTGEKITETHETDCSTFGKLFKREPKIKQFKSICEYCYGTKLISWIDEIVPIQKQNAGYGMSGSSGVSGVTGHAGYSGVSGHAPKSFIGRSGIIFTGGSVGIGVPNKSSPPPPPPPIRTLEY